MEDIKTNKMLVSVVLDRSGSMEETRAGTISGYNEYIKGLRADKKSEYSVTLMQFDSAGLASEPELTVSYEDKPLAKVPKLTTTTYEPRGMTPLYDAIGECARRVDAKGRAVTILIITDGHENASKEFTQEAVKALIKQKEAQGWTVAFLGANIDSYTVGASVGVSAMNVSDYAPGNEDALYSNLASSTVARASLASSIGVMAAASMPMFSDSQRAAMNPGGRHPKTRKRPAVSRPQIEVQPVATPASASQPARHWQENRVAGVAATPDYLSPEEAAVVLRVSSKTVYSQLQAGKIPARKVGRAWRINRLDL